MLLLKKFLPLVPAAPLVSAARPKSTIETIYVRMETPVLLVVTLVEIIPIVVGEEALIAMEEITGITAGAAQAFVALMVAPVRWKLILTILMIATGLPLPPPLFLVIIVVPGRLAVVAEKVGTLVLQHRSLNTTGAPLLCLVVAPMVSMMSA